MMKHPYRFLVIMLSLLVLATFAVVVVWKIVQETLQAPAEVEVSEPASPEIATSTGASAPVTPTTDTTSTEAPLRAADLPLTEGQRALVENLGLDIDAITISSETISCVQVALGSERYASLLAGETPSVLEGLSIMRCLGQ